MITVNVGDELGQDVTRQFLEDRLITMKQYWSMEVISHYLFVIKHNSNMIEFEHFMERYEKAPG